MNDKDFEALMQRRKNRKPREVMCPVCGKVPASEHYMGIGAEYLCGINRHAYDDLKDEEIEEA